MFPVRTGRVLGRERPAEEALEGRTEPIDAIANLGREVQEGGVGGIGLVTSSRY